MRMRTLLLVSLLLTPAITQAAFSDVQPGSRYAESVGYVEAQGIVQGYADGTFKPYATINRAEFTKILVEALASESAIRACYDEVEPAHWVFTERMHGEWYAPYVCYAKKFRLIDGYPDGTFRPSDAINFVEAAKILSISFNTLNTFCSGPSPLAGPDGCPTDGHPWYEWYVRSLAERKAIPFSIRAFDQSLTRGEMAQMIHVLHAGVTDHGSTTYEDIAGASDLDPAYPAMAGCEWREIRAHGWSFLSQDCEGQFFKRVVVTENGFEQEFSNGERMPLIEVIPIPHGYAIEDVIHNEFVAGLPKERGCEVIRRGDAGHGSTIVASYEIRTMLRQNEEGPYWLWDGEEVCGDHGMTNGIRYFADYGSPLSFLFLSIGQDGPPIDMTSITYVAQ